MQNAKFHIFITDKVELIIDPETGKIESGIFSEPFQTKSLKVYDGVVFRGGKKKDMGELDIPQIMGIARTFWELGGVRAEFVKMNLSNKGSSVSRIQVKDDDLESLMWGIN